MPGEGETASQAEPAVSHFAVCYCCCYVSIAGFILLAVLVLLGATYAVVKINGWNWRWQKQGPEYMLFWAAACVIAVSG